MLRVVNRVMKRRFPAIIVILMTAWWLNGCVDAPDFNAVPEISNVRLEMSGAVVSKNDSVVIAFDFSDGDGDIGHLPQDSVTDLFLMNAQIFKLDSLGGADTTCIDTTVSEFLIPYVPMIGGVPDITGTIRVQLLPTTFLGYCSVSEQRPDLIVDGPLNALEFSLWIMDRGGRLSNRVEVPPIPISCD